MLDMADKQQKKSETALREEEVLASWKDGRIFERSLEKDAPQGEFVFYDGPPFATGLPHWGSLLSSVSKDVIGRYKTMRGYTVPRRWGWDCHGLPIENMIEKKLDLKTKKDIEALGIDTFNEEARASVLKFADDWKHYVERVGRWVDFDNSYKTMDNTYIESVWWGLRKIHSDNRLYEGKKVLMYCPRCETPLSKAEIAMDNSYQDVTEKAVFVEFKTHDTKDVPTYILAWTTTPWTLPANVALAVGADIDYVTIEKKDKGTGRPVRFILAKERLESVFADDAYKVVAEVKGSKLVGLTYEPLYRVEKAADAKKEKTWSVLAADFVTTEDGTGVVHIAPMYGEDDYNLGVENDLPVVPLLDATGTYNDDAPELVRGMYFKKGGRYVMEDLEKRELLFATHDHTHSYPHCYRCGTPLIYNALTSWFINIQSVKKKLLQANEEVTWHPEHLKHGRFQNIIETAPDWTISRNRFWASPLPIWKHEKTGDITVLGSVEELRKHTKRSGNSYHMIRHGEAESNTEHVISSLPENKHHLTEKGKEQLKDAAKELKKAGITKIITSPFVRTRESAELLAGELGIAPEDITEEPCFMEWQLGDFNGKPVDALKQVCPTYTDRFTKGCGTGENLVEMKRRIGEALYELEQTYQDETVLIVGHEYTLWLAECVARGADVPGCIDIRGTDVDYVENAEVRALDFVPLPHNKEYELDLHRPYIDEVELVAKDGAALTRIPEVVDCWVESGSMPFASEHYPHENEEVVKRRYPGDFIAEYIAQTRTWFYYMHALGVLLFGAPSFKNCLTTGTILAADGSKMSKSKGNYTDPLDDMDKYGADAARLYLLGSVVMAAEDLAFKEEELRESHNRFVNMLWNSYKFYAMHANNEGDIARPKATHALDVWVLARLDGVVAEMTAYMDSYDTVRAARSARDFVADLSQWYIRRSRDRFRSDDVADKQTALNTTRYVLATFAKLIAPMTPYIAESVYRGVGGSEESVHLDAWPEKEGKTDEDVIRDMAEVRRVASLALEARQTAGIKVRQPLASVSVKSDILHGSDALLALIEDEVNVKAVTFDTTQDEEVVLDTELTDELVREGQVRDVVRAVQDARKKAGLEPDDEVTLTLHTDTAGNALMEAAQPELARVAGVTSMETSTSEQEHTIKLSTGSVSFSLAT
jgi:isoleucyl-tRNA synthetase